MGTCIAGHRQAAGCVNCNISSGHRTTGRTDARDRPGAGIQGDVSAAVDRYCGGLRGATQASSDRSTAVAAAGQRNVSCCCQRQIGWARRAGVVIADTADARTIIRTRGSSAGLRQCSIDSDHLCRCRDYREIIDARSARRQRGVTCSNRLGAGAGLYARKIARVQNSAAAGL